VRAALAVEPFFMIAVPDVLKDAKVKLLPQSWNVGVVPELSNDREALPEPRA
jgi:hypothetical protein